MRKLLPLVVLLAISVPGILSAQVKFTDPNRIQYDSQCFKINGKDTFIYSGAFHYYRCPQALWADRFRKIKEAGFNTVETYVPWNYHEPLQPEGFNDNAKINLKECRDWMRMAINQFGFNVIVRPGPYICAEWDSGGYPQWLLKLKPESVKEGWLRSDDPTYLYWSKHWIKAVSRALSPFQITHQPAGKPGIILFQLENEYDYDGKPDAVHIGQLKALEQQALESGIDVPFVTCWTHQVRGSKDKLLSQVFDCCNFYPRWGVSGVAGDLTKLRNEQKNAPEMVMELQGGWFSENGGLLAEDQVGITAAQINNLTLFCIQNGVAALNYYMLFGGTNFGDRTPPNITSSYDYFAPIREDGAVGQKYQAVSAIGSMLKEYGSLLIRSKPSNEEVSSQNLLVKVAVRIDSKGGRFIFVRNTSRTEPQSGELSATGVTFHYDLEAFGSKILYLPKSAIDAGAGIWLPKPAAALPKPPTAPIIRIANAARRYDDGGKIQQPAIVGMPLYRQGYLNAQYVAYRAEFDAPSAHDGTLIVKSFGDQAVVVRFNGRLVSPSDDPKQKNQYPLTQVQLSGNRLEILLENAGYSNWGDMDAPRGLQEVAFVQGDVTPEAIAKAPKLPLKWAPTTEGVQGRWFTVTDTNDDAWTNVWLDPAEAIRRKVSAATASKDGCPASHLMTWYVMAFDMPERAVVEPTRRLLIDAVGSGFIYVNGHLLGRFWQQGPQREYNVPETWLKYDSSNTITVSLRPVNGVEALKAVAIDAYPDRTGQ